VASWTDEEIETLRRVYPDPRNSFEEIMRHLPGRTENAIRLKASRLSIERKTIYGDQYTSALEIVKQAYYSTEDPTTKALLSDALDILDPQLMPKPQDWPA